MKFVKTITRVETRTFNVIIEADSPKEADALFQKVQEQETAEQPWTKIMDAMSESDPDDEVLYVSVSHIATDDDILYGYDLNAAMARTGRY